MNFFHVDEVVSLLFTIIMKKQTQSNQWYDFLKFYNKETKPENASKRKRVRIKSVSPIYNPIKHQRLKLELGYDKINL